MRVWRHEITRVIFDRLINEDDHALVRGHLVALLEAHYAEKMEFIMRDPILYGDYINTLDPSEPRLYECIDDFSIAQVCRSFVCWPRPLTTVQCACTYIIIIIIIEFVVVA